MDGVEVAHQKLSSIRPGHFIESLNSNPPLIFKLPFINNIGSLLPMLRHNILYCKTRCCIFQLLKCEFAECRQVINLTLIFISWGEKKLRPIKKINFLFPKEKKTQLFDPPTSGTSTTAALNCESTQQPVSLVH